MSEDNLKTAQPVDDIMASVKEAQLNVDEIMAKYDRESATRNFSDYRAHIIGGICILFSLIQIYAGFSGRIPATQLRPLHLGFVMLLVFLLYPIKKNGARVNSLPWYDLGLALLAFAVCMYIAINHQALAMRINKRFDPAVNPIGYRTYQIDMTIAVLLVVLLAESCRRVVGYPILIIAAIFVLYAFFGNYMPGFLAHKPLSPQRILTHLVYTTEGIMGTPLGASATFIFLFVLFGAFLETTQVGQFFIDFSNAIAGTKRGGPAKVAVLASALEGTVSGSSVANTVGSGSFTIPMMKGLGYRPEFAGAVEAAASTGGQIMPPVMGAAAFLMAESVGVSYSEIAKAAIVPAILYFSGIWIIVDLEAKKYGLKGLTKDKLPKLRSLLKKLYLILPLFAIIYFLGIGYTPMYAALIGITASALCGMIRRIVDVNVSRQIAAKGDLELTEEQTEDSKGSASLTIIKHCYNDVVTSLKNGARGVLGVAIACGVAGIIVGMITLTGLGLKMGNGLVTAAGGNVILTLVLTMMASIVLGMGVPTTANYLITSTVMAPAVIQVMTSFMGPGAVYPVLAAHMFVFYFGIVADITPPVALAAMAGAAIAKADPMKTGFNATKLAIAAFLVPYIFAFNPKMLMIDAHWWEVVQIAVTSLIGMVGIGAALEGYFQRHAHPMQRLLFLVGGLLLIDPGLYTDLVGLGIIAIAALWQLMEIRAWGGKFDPSGDFYKSMSAGQRVKSLFTESFVMLYRLITGKGENGMQA